MSEIDYTRLLAEKDETIRQLRAGILHMTNHNRDYLCPFCHGNCYVSAFKAQSRENLITEFHKPVDWKEVEELHNKMNQKVVLAQ